MGVNPPDACSAHGQSLHVRQATEHDVPAIIDLHTRSLQWAYRGLFPDVYLDHTIVAATAERETHLLQVLREPTPDLRLWLLEQDGQLVGALHADRHHGDDALPNEAIVKVFQVEPARIGTGLGRYLFAHTLADFRQRGLERALLWVLEGNTRARRFYERAGWQTDGVVVTEHIFGEPWPMVAYRTMLAPTPL